VNKADRVSFHACLLFFNVKNEKNPDHPRNVLKKRESHHCSVRSSGWGVIGWGGRVVVWVVVVIHYNYKNLNLSIVIIIIIF